MKRASISNWRVNAAIALTLLSAIHVRNGTASHARAGTVFSFGQNLYGQNGVGYTSGGISIAEPIIATNIAGKRVTQIAAAGIHNLILTADGTVYSFGANMFGGTGLNTSEGFALVATPIDATLLEGKRISQISANGFNSLLLADDGTVFSFGRNQAGQTGLGINTGDTLIATPIDATNLEGVKIAQISAGLSHSLLLAEDGTVFSFGTNSSGRTGIGTSVGSTLVATPIDSRNLEGKRIKQVSADGISLLLAEDGTVFSFGSNEFGATGSGTDSGETFIATPIDTSNLAGLRIMQVSTGLLLADDGTVYSFGANFYYGQTGLGTTSGSTLVATPIDNRNFMGKSITQVAGGSVSLLLADDGTVYSFGSNGSGATGLGIHSHTSTPIATPIIATNLAGRRVTAISAGGSHSLLLAVPEPGAGTLVLLAGMLLLAGMRSRCR